MRLHVEMLTVFYGRDFEHASNSHGKTFGGISE